MTKGIYIDVTNTFNQRFLSGIERVVREGVKNLIYNQNSFQYEIIPVIYDRDADAFRIIPIDKFLDWNRMPIGNKPEFSEVVLLPEQIPSGSVFFDLDGLWFVPLKRYYLLPLLKRRGVRIASLIFDIIPISFPKFAPEDSYVPFWQYFESEMAYADLVFTNSEFVAESIKKLLADINCSIPERIVVAPLGSDFTLFSITDPQIDRRVREIAEKNPFLLTVSTVEIRKNHKLILDAYDLFLRENTDLNIIFAGRTGWKVDDVLERMHNHPDYNKRIFHFEGLNNETISFLYQSAYYTVFPTYTEGFGLPAVESMISGTPALLSDIPVLREIAGNRAEYFDPDKPEELFSLIKQGLMDLDVYKKRREALKKYEPVTWEAFGRTLAEELSKLIDK